LATQRSEIEAELGKTLDWQELPESRASRIATYLNDSNIEDRTDWPRQHQWILKMVREFRRVFGPRVKALQLDSSVSPISLVGEEN
jgi:hypothetical protein